MANKPGKITDKEIGRFIRKVRSLFGVTLKETAKSCGMHWAYLGFLERGDRPFTPKSIRRIVGGFLQISRAKSGRSKIEEKGIWLLRRADDKQIKTAVDVLGLIIGGRYRGRI